MVEFDAGAWVMRTGILALSMMALVLGACGNGGSAVETRDRQAADTGDVQSFAQIAEPEPVVIAPLDRPVEAVIAPEKAAKVLTSNRRESAGDKAVRLFERNGRDFNADSPEDYLDKAERFSRNPPRDAEKIDRPNGDVLLYQASTNTFAVVDRRGVVRTMFKPYNGAAYWQDQKAKAPSFGR